MLLDMVLKKLSESLAALGVAVQVEQSGDTFTAALPGVHYRQYPWTWPLAARASSTSHTDAIRRLRNLIRGKVLTKPNGDEVLAVQRLRE